MPLNTSQLLQYRQEGYAVGDPLLDGRELETLRREMDQLIAQLPAGQRPENIRSVHYENEYFRRLFLSDKLVDVAEQILGPDVTLFTSYIISKRPGDGLAVAWHQDAAFFPIEPMETFTLWLAVDDADRDNGCMRVLPGTQRDRVIRPHKIDRQSGTTLPLSLDGVDTTKAVEVELKAGQYSVHDPFILHGSNANRSARRRCGITIKYIPSHVRIKPEGENASGFPWDRLRLFWARGKRGNFACYGN